MAQRHNGKEKLNWIFSNELICSTEKIMLQCILLSFV